MIDHSWVPWLRELVGKIAESGESYLIERARAVSWNKDDIKLLEHRDENIDPMSFLYTLARIRGDEALHSELMSVHEAFAIESGYPGNGLFIPRPPGVNTLFHKGGEGRPDLIWKLFRQAAEEDPKIESSDFDDALDIKEVAIKKLTQTLFIVNPRHFLPADEDNKVLPWPEFQKEVGNYTDYLARMKAIRKMFPGCEPYEINTFLATQKDKNGPLITGESKFYHLASNVYDDGLDLDYWDWNDDLDSEWKEWTFRENNIVYTGSKDNHEGQPYTIQNLKRGDIVVVHYGQSEGRGIGVVEKNGYKTDGWNSNAVVSVYWVNKKTGPLEGKLGTTKFRELTLGKGPYQACWKAGAYENTFDLIEQLQRENVPSPPDRKVEPQGEIVDQREDDSNALNTILFGPPGTGKTYEAVSHAVAIIEGKDPAELAKSEPRKQVKERFDELKEQGQIEFVTFHQNYTYEDFIEGIRPVLGQSKSAGENESTSADGNQNELTYDLHDGIFKKIAQKAQGERGSRYALIIDEINRGNIAKIFGELITLIEPSKRQGEEDAARATLPYSGESFGVPNNLYILGTMNTADRSIALLDTALRRRFQFIERMPNPDLVEKDIEGIDGQKLLTAINVRIKAKLDRQHQIGHTYLIGVKTINALADAFQRSILPLLQEYFYDDWEKIQYVLNGNPFVRKDPSAPRDSEGERPMLELLPHDDDRWGQAESYRKIYAASGGEEGNDGG